MKYEIKLTPRGERIAALSNVTDTVAGEYYPAGNYLPSEDPEKEWTVGNDILVVLGGYWDDLPTLADSPSYHDVLKAITDRVEDFDLDPSEVKEAVRALTTKDYLDIEPLDPFGVLEGTLSPLKALSDVTRMRILCLIAVDGPMDVALLSARLRSPKVTTSYHLRKLTKSNLLVGVKVGKRLSYRLSPATVRLVTMRLHEVLVEGQESI